jgi:phosphonate transport system permease protein
VTSGPVTKPVGAAASARQRRPSLWSFLIALGVLAFLVHGYRSGVTVDPASLASGAGRLKDLVADALPPDLSRLDALWRALLVTFEMALAGMLLGAALSLPLAVAAARTTCHSRTLYLAARGLIALCRTIPDLVWGLIFVVTVGLGPQAGVLAIAVDTLGFCGRFFAESIEEVDPGVLDALRSTGAGEAGVLFGGVLPSCLPAFIATAMYALESSTRSSIVLGLVGAGGIGIELTVAMQLLRYDQALTVILAIFLVVLGVERLSSFLRQRVI